MFRALIVFEQLINSATGAKSGQGVSVFTDEYKKPALGPSFTFGADGTLWLARHSDAGETEGAVFTAEVLRSRTSVSTLLVHSLADLRLTLGPALLAIKNVEHVLYTGRGDCSAIVAVVASR